MHSVHLCNWDRSWAVPAETIVETFLPVAISIYTPVYLNALEHLSTPPCLVISFIPLLINTYLVNTRPKTYSGLISVIDSIRYRFTGKPYQCKCNSCAKSVFVAMAFQQLISPSEVLCSYMAVLFEALHRAVLHCVDVPSTCQLLNCVCSSSWQPVIVPSSFLFFPSFFE